MIQRIQTVYLALAIICIVVSVCFPLGYFDPEAMGFPYTLNSLCLADKDGAVQSYLPVTLMVLDTIAIIFSGVAIMGYKNHNRQISQCNLTILVELLWVVNYGAYVLLLAPDATTFRPGFGAVLPLIAIVLTFLARKGVKADRKLLRDTERIR